MILPRHLRALATVLAFLAGTAPAATGAQLALAPVADSYVRSDTPTTTQGENPLVLVGDTATADSALRGLLRFELTHPDLAGATIERAELRLAVNGRDSASGGSLDSAHTLHLHALDEHFAEDSATWLDRLASTPWSSPGGDFDSARVLASASANPARVDPGDIVAFQSTALAEAAAAAVAADGRLELLLKLAEENPTRSVFRFDSRASASQSPRLLVDYTPAPVVTEVVPLPGHPERPLSTRYQLSADRLPVEVRAERFGFDVALLTLGAAPATIEVRIPGGFTRYSLKPARHDIAVARSGDTLRFTLDRPRKLVLQVDSLVPLAIIATPTETDVPAPGDPDVLYFGPGVTEAGLIVPQSHQTIYLAPGALVKGRVVAREVSDVKIRGRGILETSGWSTRAAQTHGILFERSRDIVVEGIGIRGYQTWWQTLFLNSRDIEVSHLNLFGVGVNTDGIDIDGVRAFLVRDTFIRAEDDGLGWHALDALANGEPNTERAVARDLVIWNTGAGNGIRIGASMETQLWRDILIEKVDILMHAGSGIYSDFSDWAWCQDLVFRDIVIERPTAPITFRILKTHYSNATGFLDERGHYERLVFDRVIMNGGSVTLAGHDADHRIDGVYFNDCVNAGVPVTGVSQLSVNPHVTNLFFNQLPPPAPTPIAGRFEAELAESSTNSRPQITYADPSLSGGKGRVLHATGAGDFVEYALELPQAGVFHLSAGVRRGPGSGRFQASVDGVALGAGHDLFSATTGAAVLDLGLVSIPAPGERRLRFVVSGEHADSAGWRLDFDYFQFTPPLEAFRARHFGAGAETARAAPDADPDGDGFANLLEYALGTSPLVADAAGAAEIALDDGRLILGFPRPDPAPFDYVVQASDDLATWAAVATLAAGTSDWSGPAAVAESSPATGWREVTVRDVAPLSAGAPRFLRLLVAPPPAP